MDQDCHRIPVKAQLATQPLGIAGIVTAARRNVLEIIPELATRQPMVSGKVFRRWHMVMDPDGLRHILRDRVDDYPKSEVAKGVVRPAIGNSLFVAEGSDWLRQRRTAAGAFTSRAIRRIGPVMAAAAERLVSRVKSAAPATLDMCDEFTAATFEVISDVTFGDGVAMQRDLVNRAISSYLAGAARASVLDIIGAPAWIPRLRTLVTDPAVYDMKRIAEQVIAQRAANSENDGDDLHSLLANGLDPETGRPMTRTELRNNLLTFIVAGHETTTLALTWSLYLLAFDQQIQDQARREVQTMISRERLSAADISRLPTIRQIVLESMRLYPPAALLLRTARVQDEICGREVRPGDMMLLPIYALHRNICYWDNPDGFEPQRFADSKTANSPAYLPFGAGPRACIGSGFAMQEAIILLAALIRDLHFMLAPGQQPEPVMVLTLRPRNGIRFNVAPLG